MEHRKITNWAPSPPAQEIALAGGATILQLKRLGSDEDRDLAVMLSCRFHANLDVVTQIGQEFH